MTQFSVTLFPTIASSNESWTIRARVGRPTGPHSAKALYDCFTSNTSHQEIAQAISTSFYEKLCHKTIYQYTDVSEIVIEEQTPTFSTEGAQLLVTVAYVLSVKKYGGAKRHAEAAAHQLALELGVKATETAASGV